MKRYESLRRELEKEILNDEMLENVRYLSESGDFDNIMIEAYQVKFEDNQV